MSTTESGIGFDVRLVLDALDEDTKKLQSQIDGAIKAVEGKAVKIQLEAPETKDWVEEMILPEPPPIEPEIDTDMLLADLDRIESEVDKTVEALSEEEIVLQIGVSDKGLKDVEREVQDVADQASASGGEGRTNYMGQPIKSASDAAKELKGELKGTESSLGSIVDKADGMERKLKRMVKDLGVIFAVIEGIGGAIDVVNLASALWSGTTEDIAKAAKDVEDRIKGIPFVGESIVKLGADINNFFTGIRDEVDAIVEATKEVDKQTARMAERAQKMSTIAKEADSLAKSMRQQSATLMDFGDEQRSAQRRLDFEALAARPESKTAKGEEIQSIKEARAELSRLEYQEAMEANRKEMSLERSFQDEERISKLRVAAKTADDMAAVTKAGLESRLRALELEGADEIEINRAKLALIEHDTTAALEKEKRARESAREIEDSEIRAQINGMSSAYEADLAAFDAVWDRKIDRMKEASKSQDEINAALAERESERLEREERQAEAVEDIRFGAKQTMQRSLGLDFQAELDRIVRQSEKKIEDAEGNANLVSALLEEQSADLTALQRDMVKKAAETEAEVSSNINLVDLSRTTEPETEKIARETNRLLDTKISGLLTQIKDAVLSPTPALTS